MKEEKRTIGKLAKAANVNIETVRFYEKKGLLKQPQKMGGFRYYPKDYITRIKFIKRSQELGFTLKEILELLNLTLKKQSKCQDVLDKTNGKILEIEEKIADLERMKASLVSLANCCEDKNIALSDCPILDCFLEE